MAVINPARAAKLDAALKKAWGETFNFEPMRAQSDVDSRFIPDTMRSAMLNIAGVWDGPADSQTPHGRGLKTDNVAHNVMASLPSANFADADLIWTPQRGDKVTRILDSTVFQVERSAPDGMGRTIIFFTNRKR